MTSTEKLQHIIEAADDLKAERIETLDVRGKTSLTDYFVVCSGTSDRHIASIADKVREELSKVSRQRDQLQDSLASIQDELARCPPPPPPHPNSCPHLLLGCDLQDSLA